MSGLIGTNTRKLAGVKKNKFKNKKIRWVRLVRFASGVALPAGWVGWLADWRWKYVKTQVDLTLLH
jgi:hypothetical protein